MIVKIQLSRFTTAKKQQMLIYSKNRFVQYEAPATKGVIALMRGKHKAYFEAVITKDKKINIVEHTPVMEQDW